MSRGQAEAEGFAPFADMAGAHGKSNHLPTTAYLPTYSMLRPAAAQSTLHATHTHGKSQLVAIIAAFGLEPCDSQP